MKWFNMWFLFSGVWIVVAVVNAFTRPSAPVLAFNVFTVVLFAALGAVQNYSNNHGEQGKKLMKRIYITVIVLLALFLLALIVWTLRQG